MKPKHVNDSEFRMHGRVITGYEVLGLMEEMRKTPLPEGVVYIVFVSELEVLPEIGVLADGMYNRMSIQIGYCNGHSRKLSALEYHRDSEVNLTVTDTILSIGRQQDITEEYTYDTELVEASLVPAGTLIRMYVTMLHYASCQTDEGGFRCAIVLPRGANEESVGPAAMRCREGKLLFVRNRWLAGRKEAELPENAWIGLKDENVPMQKYEETCFRIVRETKLANCK